MTKLENKKFNNAFQLLLKVSLIIIVFCATIGLVGLVVISLLPEASFASGQLKIEFNGLEFRFSNDSFTPTNARWLTLLSVATALTVLPSAILIIKGLLKISKTVSDGVPFANDNIKQLNIISYAIILLAFLPEVMKMLTDVYVLYGTNLTRYLIQIGAIQSATLSVMPVNFSILFLGVAILLLVNVFKRGRYLQDEYDATL